MGSKIVKELRAKSTEELIKHLNEINKELFKLLRQIKSGGVVRNPARIRLLKRTRARILTILSERGIKL